MLLIKNAKIKRVIGSDIENGYILIDNGKIVEIGEGLCKNRKCEIIDAEGRLVSPGLIDAHSHIGVRNFSMRWEGTDNNEKGDNITPQMRAIDSIYPQDEYISEAVRGGVTTVCTGPGSSNAIGGSFAIIKTTGNTVEEMLLKYPAAMKCAFGENPKNNGQNNKKMPFTRMGIASLIRETLSKAKDYYEDEDRKFDFKLEALVPVMNGEIPLKCHAHRADDIFTAIRIAKEFNIKITLDHVTDGITVADELGREAYPCIVGPIISSRSKPETSNRSYKLAGVLASKGCKVCITTDSPVTPISLLGFSAGLAASEGLGVDKAWETITINPAEVLGVSDRIGSLEVGKDADIVIWTKNPLTDVGAKAYMTIIDGKICYTLED